MTQVGALSIGDGIFFWLTEPSKLGCNFLDRTFFLYFFSNSVCLFIKTKVGFFPSAPGCQAGLNWGPSTGALGAKCPPPPPEFHWCAVFLFGGWQLWKLPTQPGWQCLFRCFVGVFAVQKASKDAWWHFTFVSPAQCLLQSKVKQRNDHGKTVTRNSGMDRIMGSDLLVLVRGNGLQQPVRAKANSEALQIMVTCSATWYVFSKLFD